MTVPVKWRAIDCTALFVSVAVFLLVAAAGCSVEDRAQRSLKKVVHTEIKQFNKFNRTVEKPKVYQSKGKFYRIYKERVEPVVNMRRTNSVDTPYIATLRFTEDLYLTRRHDTREDSSADAHFIHSGSRKREVLYAFVNGAWKKKEIH